MQTFPTWLVAALNEPFQLIPRVEWSPDWETWLPLRPLSGSHSQSRTRQNRWEFSGTFAKDYPVGDRGVHPYGPRARITLGVRTLRNPVFWFRQGVYTITAVEETEASISISGASFELDVAESGFVQVRRIPQRKNESFRLTAQRLITEAVPDARFYWDSRLPYTDACPLAYLTEGRWAAISGTDQDISIMNALGGEAYCDASGGFHFVPTPTLDDAPVWRVAKGGALISQTRGFDRQDVANVVGAGGDAADGSSSVGPVYAWDASPTSVTYAGIDPVNRPGEGAGRFGVKPVTYTSPLIRSEGQAGLAARALLANKLGLHYNLALTSRFHPGVEAGDVVETETYEDQIERHLLDGVSYQWGAADMTCEVRTPKEAYSSAAERRVRSTIYVQGNGEIEDLAEDDAGGATVTPPDPTPPPTNPEQPVTKTGKVSFTATSGKCWGNRGSQVKSTSQMYQGYYSGTWGNLRSCVFFDYAAIQTALSGKTLTKVTIKFRTKFSYYNAGMTAIVGTHNSASSITSWPGGTKTNLVRKSGCTDNEWTTLTLPLASANQFKAGTAKGITFGPGPSSSKSYYGYHYMSGSSKPVITFYYTYTV